MPRSVMEHSFARAPQAEIQRSSFNRSHGLKTTFDADWLVPVLVDEILPGDTYNVNMNFFARLATPIHPIMDNMYIDSFFFFVPNRLLWDNWEKFCGAQDDPGDSIDFTIPTFSSTSAVTTGSLGDYFGLPINQNNVLTLVSALPFRAYNQIFNYWFRDQNLTDSLNETKTDGPDGISVYALQKRAKRHDYFTSALPWPQKGDAVTMPLGTSAPIYTDETPASLNDVVIADGIGSSTEVLLNAAATNLRVGSAVVDTVNLFADLQNATAPSINDVRLAFQTQRLLERDARSGTRYPETVHAHFGVTVPDFRVQFPEYLGGGSTPVNVSPVAQTTAAATPGSPTADDKHGRLAGIGTASGTHGFTKSFVEHGILIGLVNARADITYSQGIERFWSKSTRYDFYYPVLAHIGEQSILNQEIFYADNAGTGASQDQGVFGYQERSAEYRFKPSRLTGLFKPDATGTLAAWHLSEDFSSLPALNNTFIESNTSTPLDRAIAVNTEPHFIFDAYFDMKCARPMPLFGIPGNLDRF